jgi:hypothetical protein
VQLLDIVGMDQAGDESYSGWSRTVPGAAQVADRWP